MRDDGERNGPVKITDVAALAGVAPMTVSRVLNHPHQVGEATAERVRAAIDQLGYVPNLIAGGLSSRRSRMIAAIVPTIATPVFSAAISMFTEQLGAAGYHVLLGLSGYAPEGEDSLVAAILGRQPEGLLLTGVTHSPAMRRRLATAGIPVVEIWDTIDDPADMLVGFDHHEVGAAIAEHFLAQGHRRFAAIASDEPRGLARCAGFCDTARRQGGEVVGHRIYPPTLTSLHGRQGVQEMLPLLRERTAVMCSSDGVALGAIVEAQAQGLQVPAGLAVCGFGDLEVSRGMQPAITTVSVDGAQIGRLAARCLLDRFARRDGVRHATVPFRIVARDSG